MVEVGVAGPFPADLMDAREAGGEARREVEALSAEPNGKLDLKADFGSPHDERRVRAGYVFAPKKQRATVTVQGENRLRAWVNEAPAFARESAAAVGRTFDVDLKKGWNVLLVKVANAGKPATLGVRVNRRRTAHRRQPRRNCPPASSQSASGTVSR